MDGLRDADLLSLRDGIVRRVRADIVAGHAAPGTLYSVPLLAEEFGVSTTPVREALLELSRAGLVEPVRNRGFRVVPTSLEDLNALFELRELLERFSIMALARRRKIDAETLHRLADEVGKEVAREDVAGYLDTDRAFHRELLKQAGNPRVMQIAMEQRDAMRLYGIDSSAGRDRQVASVEEHHQLVDLASASKAHLAGQLMSYHILEWKPIFAATLDRPVEVDPPNTRPLPTRQPLQHGLARTLRRQS